MRNPIAGWFYPIVTDLYQPNPSRLRDWISVPKSNGYESLHTTVIGPRGKWVEVQIRSSRMDEIAEKGLAAHFKYKGVKGEGGLDIPAYQDEGKSLNHLKRRMIHFSTKSDRDYMPMRFLYLLQMEICASFRQVRHCSILLSIFILR